MIKRILTWGGIALLIFFIAFKPSEAASVAKSIGRGLAFLANGFTDFFVGLVSTISSPQLADTATLLCRALIA